VIHNFAIIPMRVQQDAIPGKEISMWFTPVKPMETYVVCAQLCGEGHANMSGSMEIIPEADYDEWSKSSSEAASAAYQKTQAAAE
jgi:cytochrome c oxidase subunit 2